MRPTFEKLSRKKQKAILDAAAQIFAEKGYARANIADICRNAHISNGALYKYFKNKEDTFIAVFERLVKMFSINNDRYMSMKGSVYDIFKLILSDIAELAANHKPYIVIYHDLGSPSMSYFASFLSQKIEEPSKKFWVLLIQEGKRRGDIDKEIDNDAAAYFIDNQIMLFMFSYVSEHYDKRFNSYFSIDEGQLSNEEKINSVIRTIRSLFERTGSEQGRG